jgi:endonuclease-3
MPTLLETKYDRRARVTQKRVKESESLSLGATIRALKKHYGPPGKLHTRDPFELVLLENVAYLAGPARRHEAFELLKRTVGTDALSILKAKPKDLERATSLGILQGTSAAKLRECASIAINEFGGNLEEVINAPLDRAKRALRMFPGIGEPGAEKILLFSGKQSLLAPDSNGLRVLVRLGLIQEQKSYAKTYAASRVIEKDLRASPAAMQEAHLLLQQHGRTLCKRNGPRCRECPLAARCAYAVRVQLHA